MTLSMLHVSGQVTVVHVDEPFPRSAVYFSRTRIHIKLNIAFGLEDQDGVMGKRDRFSTISISPDLGLPSLQSLHHVEHYLIVSEMCLSTTRIGSSELAA